MARLHLDGEVDAPVTIQQPQMHLPAETTPSASDQDMKSMEKDLYASQTVPATYRNDASGIESKNNIYDEN